jgi:hypothetical protein
MPHLQVINLDRKEYADIKLLASTTLRGLGFIAGSVVFHLRVAPSQISRQEAFMLVTVTYDEPE